MAGPRRDECVCDHKRLGGEASERLCGDAVQPDQNAVADAYEKASRGGNEHMEPCVRKQEELEGAFESQGCGWRGAGRQGRAKGQQGAQFAFGDIAEEAHAQPRALPQGERQREDISRDRQGKEDMPPLQPDRRLAIPDMPVLQRGPAAQDAKVLSAAGGTTLLRQRRLLSVRVST